MITATKAQNINYMFAYCNGLISINLANFETSKVKSMDGVFASCGNLKYFK